MERDKTVWLASYPRSGNTWFRVLWHHYLELPTYAIHGEGHRQRNPLPIGATTSRPDRAKVSALTKTHWTYHNGDQPAIVLVRDGRDVAISYYHYLRDIDGNSLPPELLQERIVQGEIMFGSWQKWLNYWLIRRKRPADVVWTFEEVTRYRLGPKELMFATLDAIGAEGRLYKQCAERETPLPSFEELRQYDPKFFRKGKSEQFTEEAYTRFIMRFVEYQADGMRMWEELKKAHPTERGRMFR
jgi:hypothetical protein